MAHWLTELRKKPKHVRDNIAFGTAAGVTFVIAVMVYVVTGGPDTMEATNDQGPEFFETFLGQFKDELASVKEAIPEEEKEMNVTPVVSSSTPIVVSSSTATAAPTTTAASSTPRSQIRTLPIKNRASTTLNAW